MSHALFLIQKMRNCRSSCPVGILSEFGKFSPTLLRIALYRFFASSALAVRRPPQWYVGPHKLGCKVSLGGYFSYLFSSLAPRSQFSLCDKIMSNSVRFSMMTFSGVIGVASSRTGPSKIFLRFLKACPTISTSFACSSFHLHI